MSTDVRKIVFEPVKSSYIDAIAYNEKSKELRVQFSSGATWKYFDVPQAIHVSLLLAESTGRYFGKEVRGVFSGRKLEAEEDPNDLA